MLLTKIIDEVFGDKHIYNDVKFAFDQLIIACLILNLHGDNFTITNDQTVETVLNTC
jgi:hypothetical protein